MPNTPSNFDSSYYPYQKVITGANGLKGAELIPYKILTYLMDLPDAFGYTPVDDNSRPRVRLAKYLWWDDSNPLASPLPNPVEKKSMLFDPNNPDINTDEDKAKHPKGYRLYTQKVIGQSGIEAKSLLKIYIGRVFEARKFVTTIGLTAEIWTNVNLEANTKTTAYDRSFDMEQCLHEALDGVDIAGVGTISFARQDHTSNGSEYIYDEGQNVGRAVNFSLHWSEGGGGTIRSYCS